MTSKATLVRKPKVKSIVTKGQFDLSLTAEQAVALLLLVGNIAGNDETTIRGVYDDIFYLMNDVLNPKNVYLELQYESGTPVVLTTKAQLKTHMAKLFEIPLAAVQV